MRRWLPVVASVALTIVGWVVLEARSHGAIAILGVVLMGLGLFGIVIGLFALTLTSGPDREREESAREEFERTGHWPGG